MIAREPVVLRSIETGKDRPAAVKAWVKHAKKALRHSEDSKALRSVDPIEQMARMAEELGARKTPPKE